MLFNGKNKGILMLVMAFMLVITAACGANTPNNEAPANNTPAAPSNNAPADNNEEEKTEAITLNASGSSFIYPLFSKMFDVYNKENENVTVNYQSTGSGTGIKQLIEGITNFGATDAPMKDEEIEQAGGNVLHMPMTLGAVVIAFNLEGVESGKLNLTGELIADIFLGKIKNWNDPAIAAVNDGLTLPDQPIATVFRTDGSGTTHTFTDYLSAVSETWKDEIGVGKNVDFPVGIGAKGNEGLTGQLSNTPGTIGYIGLEYATENNIPVANIQNQEGEFVTPSLDSVSAAAAGAVKVVPEDLRFSMVNMPGTGSYPIAAVTWAIVRAEQTDMNAAKEIVKALGWANTEGQQYSAELNYAPLPAELQELNKKQLEKVTVDGQKVME
ncbi:phosphate ABC transporter substrate-binding protein PstS [Paenibacillus tarimensis]